MKNERTYTNYKLQDGDFVELLIDYDCFKAGIRGTVTKARTPKVTCKPGDSLYFANVDTDFGRLRCPHALLRVIKITGTK